VQSMTTIENASIIVVDDQPTNLKLLEDMLKVHGYKIRSFPRGRLALAAAVQNPPDLFLLDINMPEMNGYDVCERLKSHPVLAATPVIFLSALNAAEDKIKAFQTGGADYINKPFQLEEVKARIHTHLTLSALQQRLRLQNDQLEQLVSQRTQQLEVAVNRIRSMYDQTLRALGGALDLRDNETAGHSQRVTRYSLEIGRAMACSEEEMGELALGASLHDIGKIGIPDAILLKPGKLSREETEIMRRHVNISYELVNQHLFLSHAAQIVLTHHESYDGSGYPQGLIGKEIPLGARIFAVADTMDAMTSDRPYRNALPYEIAREEIVRCSGSQFDPDVVQAFLGIPKGIWEHIRTQSDLDTYSHRIRSCFETPPPLFL
jgi:response regulator RpfG family c-di-GMP phosphodiesterase